MNGFAAVVMAGGNGERLRPLTDQVPKPMLPMGVRPLLELIVEQLSASGARRIYLATRYRGEVIANHFGDGRHFGVEVVYLEEREPLGTAGAIGLLDDAGDDPVLVMNGDVLAGVDFRAMIDLHRAEDAQMTIAVRDQEYRVPYGVLETDGARVVGIREKPVLRCVVNAGIYVVSAAARRRVPRGQPLDMPDLIHGVIDAGERVVSYSLADYWFDIGHVEDYVRARREFGVR